MESWASPVMRIRPVILAVRQSAYLAVGPLCKASRTTRSIHLTKPNSSLGSTARAWLLVSL